MKDQQKQSEKQTTTQEQQQEEVEEEKKSVLGDIKTDKKLKFNLEMEYCTTPAYHDMYNKVHDQVKILYPLAIVQDKSKQRMTGLRFEFLVTAIVFAVVILINQFIFQYNIALFLAILAIAIQYLSQWYFKKYGHFNIFLIQSQEGKSEDNRVNIYNKLKDGLIELEEVLKLIIHNVEKKKKK